MSNRQNNPATPSVPVAVPPKPAPPANIDLRTGIKIPTPRTDSGKANP